MADSAKSGMSGTAQRVAIAVVEDAGRYLVGTRKAPTSLAGQAEFPGGKCLPGEESAACAVRECREETGLVVTAIRCLYACRHAYPHGTLDLEFWLCRPETSAFEPPTAGGFEWLPAQALQSLRFPDANEPVLRLIAVGPLSVG